MDDEELLVKHVPQNRETSEAKVRRSPKHCPVCLASLEKNAKRTRLMAQCTTCKANVSPGKVCARCQAETIWENKTSAACRTCGAHGAKALVIGRG